MESAWCERNKRETQRGRQSDSISSCLKRSYIKKCVCNATQGFLQFCHRPPPRIANEWVESCLFVLLSNRYVFNQSECCQLLLSLTHSVRSKSKRGRQVMVLPRFSLFPLTPDDGNWIAVWSKRRRMCCSSYWLSLFWQWILLDCCCRFASSPMGCGGWYTPWCGASRSFDWINTHTNGTKFCWFSLPEEPILVLLLTLWGGAFRNYFIIDCGHVISHALTWRKHSKPTHIVSKGIEISRPFRPNLKAATLIWSTMCAHFNDVIVHSHSATSLMRMWKPKTDIDFSPSLTFSSWTGAAHDEMLISFQKGSSLSLSLVSHGREGHAWISQAFHCIFFFFFVYITSFTYAQKKRGNT